MTTLLTRPSVADHPAPLPPTQEAPPAPPPPVEKPARLVSLDAYRGAIMLFMASGGLAIPAVAKKVAETWPNRPLLVGFWNRLAFHTDHVEILTLLASLVTPDLEAAHSRCGSLSRQAVTAGKAREHRQALELAGHALPLSRIPREVKYSETFRSRSGEKRWRQRIPITTL